MIEYEYQLNSDMCYLIGVVFGDGNIEHNQIRIGVKDLDFANNISKVFRRLFKRIFIPKMRKNNDSFLYHINLNSVIIAKRMKNGLSDIKNITDYVLLTSFLSGAFDAEGHVEKKRLRIRLSVKNKQYGDAISNSLNKINIIHTYRFYKDFYCISIYGSNVLRFAESGITFSVKKRKWRLLTLYKNSMINEEDRENSIGKKYGFILTKNKMSMKKLKYLIESGKV